MTFCQHLGHCLDKVIFMAVGHDITLDGTLSSLEVTSTDVTSFTQYLYEFAFMTPFKLSICIFSLTT